MTKYGVQISQEGVPVASSADYQRIIDSEARALEIFAEYTIAPFTVTNLKDNSKQQIKLATHNLGFHPGFESSVVYSHGFFGGLCEYADESNIWLQVEHQSFGPDTFTIDEGIIRVYRYPILEEYKAETSLATSGASSRSRYGMKIVNPEKNGRIDDYDTYKFSINSEAKTLNVHQSGVLYSRYNYPDKPQPEGLTMEIGVKHDLGYNPTYLLTLVLSPEAIYNNTILGDKTGVLAFYDSSDFLCQSDGKLIQWRGAQALAFDIAAFIILKDPVEIIG